MFQIPAATPTHRPSPRTRAPRATARAATTRYPSATPTRMAGTSSARSSDGATSPRCGSATTRARTPRWRSRFRNPRAITPRRLATRSPYWTRSRRCTSWTTASERRRTAARARRASARTGRRERRRERREKEREKRLCRPRTCTPAPARLSSWWTRSSTRARTARTCACASRCSAITSWRSSSGTTTAGFPCARSRLYAGTC
mmetsp:Transcript_6288/g.28385  ORF Transcript_6288/g.28385 Transcript_6288/m.28385 type:complete len:203 (+) Transcript_6288:368-976(+)